MSFSFRFVFNPFGDINRFDPKVKSAQKWLDNEVVKMRMFSL